MNTISVFQQKTSLYKQTLEIGGTRHTKNYTTE